MTKSTLAFTRVDFCIYALNAHGIKSDAHGIKSDAHGIRFDAVAFIFIAEGR